MCDSMFGWSLLILPFPSEGSPQVETLRQEESHISLIHQGEVVLELETELEPSLLIVVVLDRFRSKLQDFCDVCCRHVTAPLPCANFRLRCDTIDDSGGSTQRHDEEDKCAK